MTEMEFMSVGLPPKLAGDVTIARFSGRDDPEKWLVSTGNNHFLTDRATAEKIAVLVGRDHVDHTYDSVYVAYRASAGQAVTRQDFIDWCEKHRGQLEGLASTADTHALSHRRLLLSATACERIAARLGWLFHPWVFAPSWLAGLALVAFRTIGGSPPALPGNYWLAAGLALIGVLVHEFGHVTACVRYGARQGGIGVGIYWIWPAFYADVRGSWILGHAKRAMISMGGLYFQSLYLAALCIVELTFGDGTVSAAIGLSMLLMFTTLNPVFKYDGYWILSDLLNVTNLHARISAHLQALVRSDGVGRQHLLRAGMTGVSLVFVGVAAGYIVYLLAMLARVVAGELSRLPELWLLANRAVGQRLPLFGEAGMAVAKFSSTLLGTAFLCLVIAVLGYRSLRSARKVFVQP